MKQQQVRDIMSREVTTLSRNEKLTLAGDIMELGRVRHLPVLDDDGVTLVGILSQRDLFRGALAKAMGYGGRAQRKLMDALLVKEVMTVDPVTTTPDTSLVDAAKILMDRKIGCLPVLEDGRLVGILTESDFVSMYVAENR